ncbi:MAG: class I SAM-dependent methyltransferase [Patescibacteria group bacterium]|nr:class I SAM-dependent methyltransferase [Patescibacteria group bacterium]
MTDDYWSKLHALYSQTDWAAKPSLFAETVKSYLPKSGTLLELGAGLGQDSAYFSDSGYRVTATDLNIDKLTVLAGTNFSVQAVDLRQDLPFENNSFDIVYAHLSLHYFDQATTNHLFAEIHRIVTRGGTLAFFTNSTDDPEYDTGVQIEPDYFEIDGTAKRYLNVQSARQFSRDFKPILADNKGETYKDSAKGVHNLIRFIGTKK